MGSRPRKIGIGVPNILGFVERGCREIGVPIFFCDTGTNSRSIHHTSIHNANKFQLKYTL